MSTRFGLLALTLGGFLIASSAMAADKKPDSTESSDAAPADEAKPAEGEPAAEADDKGNEPVVKAAPAPSGDELLVEDPSKSYLFVGARYRLILIPKFILGMFADGGKTVAVHSGGLEFSTRKANFEIGAAAWLAGYSMDPTPFKGKADGEDAWEIIESRIKVLYFTTDILWSHDFNPRVAVNYGLGVGLGVVWGSLYRTQAYRGPGGELLKCVGQGNPGGSYCGFDNDHYNGYSEAGWTSGGSKPVVFPWLALQTGLRYKPHKNFVGRLDLGLGLSGFFFGLGADYGI